MKEKILPFFRKKTTIQINSPFSSKIYFFSFSSFSLHAFLVFITLFSVLAIVYWLKKDSIDNRLQVKKQQVQEIVDDMEEVNRQLEKIKQYHVDYRKEMQQIMDFFGLAKDANFWATPRQGIVELFELDGRSQQITFENEVGQVLQLDRNRKELLAMFSHLESLENYIDLRNAVKNNLPLGWPILGNRGYKTSGYGMRFSPFSGRKQFHTGVDIAAFPGTPIVAVASGKVVVSKESLNFGNVVILSHKYGHKTVYGHNKENLVSVGQKVKKGQPIAEIGSTGRSTGYHVHFEVILGKKHTNPWPYVIADF